MKKFLGIILILAVFSACVEYGAREEVTEEKQMVEKVNDGVFIHISHGTDDPHRVLMALNMANMMSKDKDVIVYFDIKGIEVVLKDAEDIAYSHFPSSKTAINQLLENGTTVMACPGCLKAAGKTAEDLMDGISVAEKEKFFNFTDGRIITLDY